jgi:hypothetical protein
LWIRIERGGFEYFVVTTQYPRLEVLPIWKKCFIGLDIKQQHGMLVT